MRLLSFWTVLWFSTSKLHHSMLVLSRVDYKDGTTEFLTEDGISKRNITHEQDPKHTVLQRTSTLRHVSTVSMAQFQWQML